MHSLSRAERQRLFSTAAVDEDALERIEGTAEYTGIMAATDKLAARIGLARQDLSRLPSFPSFTRAFAYATGPAYGLLLDAIAGPGWRKQYVAGANFDALLTTAIGGPAASETVATRARTYDGPALAEAEHNRELARIRRDAALRASLVKRSGARCTDRHPRDQLRSAVGHRTRRRRYGISWDQDCWTLGPPRGFRSCVGRF